MKPSYSEVVTEDARLAVLKEMAEQADGRLNEVAIQRVLDTFGYRRSRDWVRTQLRKLEELDAVTVIETGTVLVGSITRSGLDHVERRAVIEGVTKPSPAN